MRRSLNPTVALITFFTGVSAAALWFIVQHQDLRKPRAQSVSLSDASIPPQVNPKTEKYVVYSALIKGMYVEDRIKLLGSMKSMTGITPPTSSGIY